jgi:hypothetical protein
MVKYFALMYLALIAGCCEQPQSDASSTDSAESTFDAAATTRPYCWTANGNAEPCGYGDGTGNTVSVCIGITMVCPATHPLACTVNVCADNAITCPDSVCAPL